MSPKDQRPIKKEIRHFERRIERLRERLKILKISDRNAVMGLDDRDDMLTGSPT